MRFSTLSEIKTSSSTVDVFGGYNHNIKIGDGEFYDMKNLSSTYYPVLSPRGKRGVFAFTDSSVLVHSPCGLLAKDSLCYVDAQNLYIDGKKVNGLVLTKSPKQITSMGAYIIIMPDKKYVNVQDTTDFGDIEAEYESTTTVTYSMCNIGGEVYEDMTVSSTEPENPSNGDYWLDTSADVHTLKQYSSSTSMWVSIATTYIRIAAKNISKSFEQLDAVTISGIDESLTQLSTIEGQTSILWDVYRDSDNDGNGDYIVVVGFLDQVSTQTGTLTVKRLMPNMDFMIESGNRLWGCRYGEDINGNIVNEIYASRLGNFRNWNFFASTTQDSYAVSLGTDGPFTGAITHLGYPLFFKENCIHKIYGNYPSNYQVQTTECRGVMKGAGNSLAIVNEALIYKSRNGVCWYDGSLPSEISSALGDIHYTGVDDSEGCDPLRNGAVAGVHQNKYYISMKSEVDDTWNLFVFDVNNGFWHKEDNTRVDAFCSCNGEMYYIDHDENRIKTILGSGTVETDDIEWMAETGIVGTSIKQKTYTTSLPGKKYVSQMLVRMSLELGARVMFFIQYDSKGEWEHISTMTGTNILSFNVPIRPKRCDHFRIRLVGKGNAKIYSINKTIEQGSDI